VVERVAHTLLVGHRSRNSMLPPAAGDPITMWVDDAVRRRQKVLYELEPAESRAQVPAALLDGDARRQVEVLEPAAVRAESSGTAEGLALMHRARVREAHAQGWTGLAVVTGPAVFTAVALDGADTAAMHEHGVGRVVVEAGMSALCRYRPDRHPGLADLMLAGHFADVHDGIWGARLVVGVLYLRGEIDVSNADHVSHVLRGALEAGVRVVDLAALEFCAAAGVRALGRAAESLPAGETLVLANPGALLRHVFAVAHLSDRVSLEPRGEA
jgi:anti-anti-sigma factor